MPTCLDACFSYSCTATTQEKHSEGKRDHGRRRGMKTASHIEAAAFGFKQSSEKLQLQNRGQHLFHTKTFKNGEFLCSRGCKVEKLAKMWWCDFREQDLRQVILLCINCRYNAVHLFFDLEHWPSYWTPKRDWMMAMNSRIFQFLQNSPLHLDQVAYS